MALMKGKGPVFKRLRWLHVGLAWVGLASAVAMVATVYKAVLMVRGGRGLETYRTFWLAEDNWVGFLVFAGCLVFALAIGALLRWRERRQWRKLEERYGNGDGGP